MTHSLQAVFLLNFTGGQALIGMFGVGLCPGPWFDSNITIKPERKNYLTVPKCNKSSQMSYNTVSCTTCDVHRQMSGASYMCISIGQLVECVHVLKSEYSIHVSLPNNILSYRLP